MIDKNINVILKESAVSFKVVNEISVEDFKAVDTCKLYFPGIFEIIVRYSLTIF